MSVLSKSVLRQVLATDLIESVCDAVEGSLNREDTELDAEARRRLARLRRHRQSWFRHATGSDVLVLDEKDYKRYTTILDLLRAEILSHFGSEANAMEYINATLLFVEDVAATIPSSPVERKAAANDTVYAMVELYDLYDPEGTAHEEMRNGTDFGENMKRASKCW